MKVNYIFYYNQNLFLTNKKVIFGSNFNSTVLTKGVDIFVRFFAQWNGHCIVLSPIYTKLVEKLSGNDKLIIGELGGTVYEVHFLK